MGALSQLNLFGDNEREDVWCKLRNTYLQRLSSVVAGVEVIKDIPYTDSNHEKHFLDVYIPTSNSTERKPVVVHCHGGGWQRGLGKATFVDNLQVIARILSMVPLLLVRQWRREVACALQ